MRDAIGAIDYVRAHLEEALATDARVSEVAPGFAVRNETLVVRLCEPDGEETVE